MVFMILHRQKLNNKKAKLVTFLMHELAVTGTGYVTKLPWAN